MSGRLSLRASREKGPPGVVSENGEASGKSSARLRSVPKAAVAPEDVGSGAGQLPSPRDRFLASRIKALSPFLPSDVKEHLSAVARDNAGGLEAEVQDVVMPAEFQGHLRPHQVDGVRWLIRMFTCSMSCILGDEMGLGKTIQTIALLAFIFFSLKLPQPALLVVPLATFDQWEQELRRWCSSLVIRAYYSTDHEERERQRRSCGNDFHVLLTTYDTLKDEASKRFLMQKTYSTAVFDEGHVLRNGQAIVSVALRSIKARFKLLLTGTAVQNEMFELLQLLHLLHPDVFYCAEAFQRAFDLSRGGVASDRELLRKAHGMVETFMLRRLKSQVEPDLLPYEEIVISLPLAPSQRKGYLHVLQEGRGLLKAGAAADGPKILNLISKLLQVCSHAHLAGGEVEAASAEELFEHSTKLELLDRLLLRLKEAGHRALIFCQLLPTLRMLVQYCMLRGYKFVWVDGQRNRAQRAAAVRLFMQPESDAFLFVSTTRAGGTGTNLQGADRVIMFESDWNPHADRQAIARAHRIGQTQQVHVYRLLTCGTAEQRVFERAEKKVYLHEVVTRDSTSDAKQGIAIQEQGGEGAGLASLVFGVDLKVQGAAGRPISDEELDVITSSDRQPGDLERFRASKHSAAAYEVEKETQAVRELEGTVVHANKPSGGASSSADDTRVGSSSSSGKKRARQQRLQESVHVPGVGAMSVLKVNSVATSEPSCKKPRDEPKKPGYLHSDWCLKCWNGGDLWCCDFCPAAFHQKCVPANHERPVEFRKWKCPQHTCCVCGRGPSAGGGAVFRCTTCPGTWCCSHLPDSVRVLHGNGYYDSLGYHAGTVAISVLCSESCRSKARLNEEEEPVLSGLSGASS